MELPDKVYFRIGEVATLLGVEPHVVRFWQAQFPAVRPERSHAGRFLYSRAAVERLARIRTLLYDQGYTIAGAKKALAGGQAAEPTPARPATADVAQAAVDAGTTKQAVELQAEVERLRREIRGYETRLESAKVSEAAQRLREAGSRSRQKAEVQAALADAEELVALLAR